MAGAVLVQSPALPDTAFNNPGRVGYPTHTKTSAQAFTIAHAGPQAADTQVAQATPLCTHARAGYGGQQPSLHSRSKRNQQHSMRRYAASNKVRPTRRRGLQLCPSTRAVRWQAQRIRLPAPTRKCVLLMAAASQPASLVGRMSQARCAPTRPLWQAGSAPGLSTQARAAGDGRVCTRPELSAQASPA